MDFNALTDEPKSPTTLSKPTGIKVRDMIRKYDTAVCSDSTKTSYSSIISTKSSYFGVNAPAPAVDDNPSVMFNGASQPVQEQPAGQTNESTSSRNTVRGPASPRLEIQTDLLAAPLENQKSFMNLSRTRDPPRAAPREKKPRNSTSAVSTDENPNAPIASYQSKTTISKTPSGVRIIIDMFFDQDKGLSIQDVVGSRVETDIPPSKILNEFQKRVSEYSRN